MLRRFLAGMFLLSAAIYAQTGQITGIVTDSSGAFVPGAQITVTNTETALARSTVTNSSGNYSVPLLQPGVYRVTVQANGFKSATRDALRLQVDDSSRRLCDGDRQPGRNDRGEGGVGAAANGQ